MGVKVNFESYYNKIRLSRLRSEEKLANTFQGYMLNTSVEPYFQMAWNRLTWEVRVPLSLLNIHFENVGENKDFRHDDTYANVNTTLAWKVTKGLKFRLRGGSRCNFGDISNFVTSPIFYTYKDAMTKGTGSLTNRNSLCKRPSRLPQYNRWRFCFAYGLDNSLANQLDEPNERIGWGYLQQGVQEEKYHARQVAHSQC